MNRMRPLTDREKRTIRFGAIGIAIFLVLLCGFQIWKFFEKKRADYRELATEARIFRQRVQPYHDRVLIVQKLMDDFHLDPAKLKPATAVSDASAAIQQAAKAGGLQIGSIREIAAHGSGKTLATLQLESSGQVQAALTFLASLNRIGFPVVVDSVQFATDISRPGQVKMSLTIFILDFDLSKEAPHA